MCIMEVRPGQHSSTIAQACAHNLSTIDRDIDMFVAVLNARGDTDGAQRMRHVQDYVHHAYADALEAFEDEVLAEVQHWHTHDDDALGNEREHEHAWVIDIGSDGTVHCHNCGETFAAAFAAQAHRDADLARKYETR